MRTRLNNQVFASTLFYYDNSARDIQVISIYRHKRLQNKDNMEKIKRNINEIVPFLTLGKEAKI